MNKKDIIDDKINNYLLTKSGIALKKVACFWRKLL